MKIMRTRLSENERFELESFIEERWTKKRIEKEEREEEEAEEARKNWDMHCRIERENIHI